MRIVFFVFCFLVSVVSIGQDQKELIKIEVSEHCKDYISKRTYENSIFTKQFDLVSEFGSNSMIQFAYQESRLKGDYHRMIFFLFNENFFNKYVTKPICLRVDGKEFILDRLVEYYKSTTLTVLGDPVRWYSLGFNFDEDLKSALSSCKNIELELTRIDSKAKRKWELSEKLTNDIRSMTACFDTYVLPIELELFKKKEFENANYMRSLKSYPLDFRNFNWETSREDVISGCQDSVLYKDNNSIFTNVTLNGSKFNCIYYFTNNQLYQGVYVFAENFVNENNFYMKYKDLFTILQEKYGEPREIIKNRSREVWNDENEIGLAIQYGEYVEFAVWQTTTSEIVLTIEGENYQSKISVRYRTTNSDLLKTVQEKEKVQRVEGF